MLRELHFRTGLCWLSTALLTVGGCLPSLGQRPSTSVDELVWGIRYDPKTLDPAKVDEQASESIRYLTAGVLVRVNRQTQQPEPSLAESWRISQDGRELSFHLRKGLRFSDGTELTSRDVAWSLKRVLSPSTAAPVAEEFISPGAVQIEVPDALSVRVRLPARVTGIAKVFDEIAIEPAGRPSSGTVTAGPYVVAEYKLGQFVRLRKNPNYWKRDASGTHLPYISSIRLDVTKNREQEVALFQRGEYDIVDNLSPEYYDLLAAKGFRSVRDLGPSLNVEQIWFNQVADAPLPEFERAWFRNREFRTAISQAIHRSDLARIAYSRHATPAYGFISPANTLWYNSHLKVPGESVTAAKSLLAASGFRLSGGVLHDTGGHVVRFSILTNAGNDARQKMAALIQQDLAALGIQVTIVTLDFPALIERLMHTQAYEACLLGLTNVDPDPNSMMNLWMSSSPNHQWNPSEKKPATSWEAEIDAEMQTQASSASQVERQKAVNQVQQIVADQQPFIYLVYPDALYAISPELQGIKPVVFQPGVVWNIEDLRWGGDHR